VLCLYTTLAFKFSLLSPLRSRPVPLEAASEVYVYSTGFHCAVIAVYILPPARCSLHYFRGANLCACLRRIRFRGAAEYNPFTTKFHLSPPSLSTVVT
jgi:hypothetical protein